MKEGFFIRNYVTAGNITAIKGIRNQGMGNKAVPIMFGFPNS